MNKKELLDLFKELIECYERKNGLDYSNNKEIIMWRKRLLKFNGYDESRKLSQIEKRVVAFFMSIPSCEMDNDPVKILNEIEDNI